jgi:hypothetical protein
MEDKIYLGNGTEKFQGNLISFSLNLSKLREAKEHFFEINGTQYIKIKVQKKKESPDRYGKTHNVEVDTFKPEPKNEFNPQERPVGDVGRDEPEEDLPF